MWNSAYRTPLIAAVAFSLAGCGLTHVEEDPDSPYYKVSEGAVLELHRPVDIRPGSTRIWFVRGHVVPGRDWYATSCSLEINTLDRTGVQTVEPGRFEVTRVQLTSDNMAKEAPRVHVAATGGQFYPAVEQNWMWSGYHLWLDSAEQPDVRQMTCKGVFGAPKDALPPSINEIRTALGDHATLHLAK